MRGAKRSAGNFLVLEVKPTRRNRVRLGITVTKKFGRAYQRNRFKRLVREAFRQKTFEGSFDLHIRPRTEAVRATFAQIRDELHLLAHRQTSEKFPNN